MTFYVAMALAAYVVEGVFGLLRLTPPESRGHGGAMQMTFAWDYTTWLNIAFLVPALILSWRFLTTGGPKMLKMMDRPRAGGDRR